MLFFPAAIRPSLFRRLAAIGVRPTTAGEFVIAIDQNSADTEPVSLSRSKRPQIELYR